LVTKYLQNNETKKLLLNNKEWNSSILTKNDALYLHSKICKNEKKATTKFEAINDIVNHIKNSNSKNNNNNTNKNAESSSKNPLNIAANNKSNNKNNKNTKSSSQNLIEKT